MSGRASARRLTAGLVAVTVIAAAPALAGSPSTVPKNEGWQFDATPYIWAAGLDGDVKIGRLPAGGVEASFSDIWNALHFALMGSFEGRKGAWGFMADAVYFDVSQSEPTSNALFGEAGASFVQQMYTGVATYRILDGNLALDLLLGARYSSLATDVTLTPGAAPGRSGSASKNWWDAVGGARVVYHPDVRWSVAGYLDVGGGGSKFAWQAVAGAGYQFNKVVSLKFGYRYIRVDYEDGDFLYDMASAGPYAGVGFHF